MEGGRRRRQLTPLSGELRAQAEWRPVDPVAEQRGRKRRRRRERRRPETTLGMLLFGLRRFVLFGGGLAGAVAGIAALIVWLTGSSATRVFPLAFYVGGAFFGALAFFGGTGTYSRYYWSQTEKERAFNLSFVYICFALLLIGIGVALETLL